VILKFISFLLKNILFFSLFVQLKMMQMIDWYLACFGMII